MKSTRPTFIGLVGPSGSGKTTVCEYLEKTHGFTLLHVAHPLKRAFSSMFQKPLSYTERPLIDQPADWLGGVAPRAVLEHIGTKLHEVAPLALPLTLQERLANMLKSNPGGHFLVDGLRRGTEAEVLRDRGGRIWRVEGPVDPDKPCDLSQAEVFCDINIPWRPAKEDLYALLDDTLKAMRG
jgi:hypothetical protein